MTARRRAAVVLLLVFFFTSASLAGRLADLPWDDKVPQEIRSGVRYALGKEASELTKQVNEAGKKFVRVHPSDVAEPQPDGTVLGYSTVQRCLADKMVTERWRYTMKKGKDYEIIKREKIAETDDSHFERYEKSPRGRALGPTVFRHDMLTLTLDGGSYFLSFIGDKPSGIHYSGPGRLVIKPPDDYEAMFFQRRFNKAQVDTAVNLVEFDFHVDDPQFAKLIGYAPGAAAAEGDPKFAGGLSELAAEIEKDREGKEYTPYLYSPPERSEFIGRFTLRVKTADHGWLIYNYDPTAVKEISIALERSGLSLRAGDKSESYGVSHYYAPETRALPLAARERRRGLRIVSPIRVDGMFDVAADRFAASVTAELLLLRDTREGFFYLGGNPSIRSIKLDGDTELMFVPFPNLGSRTFGFKETSNFFKIYLPEERKAGTTIRLTVNYDSPDLVRKVSEGFWYVERIGFLPILGDILADQIYMHFVVRSKVDYSHVSIGTRLAEETDSYYRYTEWGADQGFNFPTLIIGKYFTPPIEATYDGIKYTGYMTRSFMGWDQRVAPADVPVTEIQSMLMSLPEPTRKDMEPQVMQAAQAVRDFARWFNAPYSFKELKLVGTPAQGLSAQSPSSIVYVGEMIFWPDQALADMFRGLDPTWTHYVTAHEVAHQWFGGQVSNVSDLHYWWVESLSEVSSAFYAQARQDDNALRGTLASWRNRAFNEDWKVSLLDDINYLRVEPGTYGTSLRYTKGPYVFWMLKEYFGEQKVIQFLRNMVQWRAGDLCSTSDVQDVAERTFGQNMDWFFDQYIRDVGIPEVRYQFDSPRPAEDGQGWVITGKLTQQIMVKGSPAPGKVFKNLLVPITVPTANGPQKIKEIMDTPEKDIRIRVEAKPTGALKVNDNNVAYMTTKEL